jgi:transposase
MTFVPVKLAEAQAKAMILTVRELPVKQQMQAINALRGHANECGVIAAKGTSHVEALLARITEDSTIPARLKRCLRTLVRASPNCRRAWPNWSAN